MRILCVALVLACGDSKPGDPAHEPPSDPRLALDLPQVSKGYLPFVEAPITVTLGPTGIVMDGTPIVAVRNGETAPEEREGGKLGIKIVKLTQATKATVEKTKADRAALLFDRNLPYRLMVSVIYSMKSDTGLQRFELVGKAEGALVSVPIVLPERRPTASVAFLGGDHGKRDPGSDVAAQLAQIRASKPHKVGTGSPGLAIVTATITPQATLSADIVSSKLRAAYGRGLRRCAGKADAGKQRVTIEATIDRTGRAVSPKVKAKPDVASCIEGLVGSWRFPSPRVDGEPAGVALSLTLELEPQFEEVAIDDGPQGTADRMTADQPGIAVGGRAPGNPDEQPLGMFVSIMKDQMIVWSLSRLEGSLRDPVHRYRLPDPEAMRRLTRDLTSIVKKRWDGKPRPVHSRSIVIQADGATPVQWIAEVIGAVRTTQDGGELFPDIQLSTGFE